MEALEATKIEVGLINLAIALCQYDLMQAGEYPITALFKRCVFILLCWQFCLNILGPVGCSSRMESRFENAMLLQTAISCSVIPADTSRILSQVGSLIVGL